MSKFKIFVLIAALAVICAAVAAAASMSGGGEKFAENYISNVKSNVQTIADKINIHFPTQKSENTKNTDSPRSASESAEPTEPSSTPEQTPQKAEKSTQEGSVYNTVAMADADLMQYAAYKDYLICADTASLMAFNKDGTAAWAIAMPTKKPILKVSGSYILLAEKDGSKISLFVGNKLIYSVNTENSIFTASVSENGDVVAVTDRSQYKGSVIVYNKNGEQVFVWNSGNYDILDADISSARNVAVSLLNTENGVKTCVSFFDINEKQPYASPEFDDTLIFDIEFLGETLNVVGDNLIAGITNRGKVKWSVDLTGKKLAKYVFEPSGCKLLMFDNSLAAQIQLLDKNGKEKTVLKSEAIPDCLDISSNRIAYNNGRELLFGEYSGNVFKSCKTDRDIKNVIILNSSSAVIVYSGSLEFCEF